MFNFFPKNVGRVDQLIRLSISTGMIYAAFVNEALIQDKFSSTLLGSIGVLVLMVTVIMRSCPLYRLVGWSTCRDKHRAIDSE